MTAPLRMVKPAISYNIPEAALAIGVGETKIRNAIKGGSLTPRFVDSRAVLLAVDLLDWVAALPTERP